MDSWNYNKIEARMCESKAARSDSSPQHLELPKSAKDSFLQNSRNEDLVLSRKGHISAKNSAGVYLSHFSWGFRLKFCRHVTANLPGHTNSRATNQPLSFLKWCASLVSPLVT
jgi:hypothetical protein